MSIVDLQKTMLKAVAQALGDDLLSQVVFVDGYTTARPYLDSGLLLLAKLRLINSAQTTSIFNATSTLEHRLWSIDSKQNKILRNRFCHERSACVQIPILLY
jgi:hypothetical protein